MRVSAWFVSALASGLLLGCATWSTGPELGARSTFEFAQPLSVEASGFPDDIEAHLRRTVADALAERGLAQVASGADLVVDVFAQVAPKELQVGVINPEQNSLMRARSGVMFTSRHTDGLEVGKVRVDEGELVLLLRPVGSTDVLFQGNSARQLRRINRENAFAVIESAVRDALADWRVRRQPQ